MGSGTMFDPIKSIEAFGLGEFSEQSTQLPTIPDTSFGTGAILEKSPETTFGETEEATIRKSVTKKRMGTRQARIPLQTSSISKED